MVKKEAKRLNPVSLSTFARGDSKNAPKNIQLLKKPLT